MRVNCISPGAISTPIFWGGSQTLTPEENRARLERLDRWWVENRAPNRPGNPDDIAHAAVFLGTDESAHISGHNLMVDAAATVTRGPFEDLQQMKADRARYFKAAASDESRHTTGHNLMVDAGITVRMVAQSDLVEGSRARGELLAGAAKPG